MVIVCGRGPRAAEDLSLAICRLIRLIGCRRASADEGSRSQAGTRNHEAGCAPGQWQTIATWEAYEHRALRLQR